MNNKKRKKVPLLCIFFTFLSIVFAGIYRRFCVQYIHFQYYSFDGNGGIDRNSYMGSSPC